MNSRGRRIVDMVLQALGNKPEFCVDSQNAVTEVHSANIDSNITTPATPVVPNLTEKENCEYNVCLDSSTIIMAQTTLSGSKQYNIENIKRSESREDDDDRDKDPDNVFSTESSTQEIDEEKTIKLSRKRVRNESNWLKSKSKLLRNAGKEYTSSSKSKKICPAKIVQAPCSDNCKYKCKNKICEDKRLVIFNEFYSLNDINRKREFISRNMECIKPKYRYPQPQSRRLNNAFYFHIEQEKVRVCKLFFKKTLDINDRTIETVVKKRTSTGSVSSDLRGKHGKHRRIDNDIKNGIRKHINSIPRIESHYLHAQTNREFIEGGKTIADLHRDYKNQCEDNNEKNFGNYHLYNDIFNTEFNISFFVPKKDQCNLCYMYKNASEYEKLKLQTEFENHQKEKKLSRIEKEQDKKRCNDNFIVACFDMQAVFQVPKGDISIFYYKSKLNVMNLTVSGLADDDTWCYVWHEGEGGKGSIEVGSCILLYLQKKAENCNSDDLEIVLFSDNCAAQQKNRFLIAVLMYAVQKLKIKRITHKFLVVGHTQNEGDSTHSTIEKQVSCLEVSRSLKSGPIYITDQFIQLIRISKKKGKPYNVNELSHEDFINVKQLMTDMGPNFNFNLEGEQAALNNLRVIKVEKDQPYNFFYKTSFSDCEFKTVNVFKSPRRATKSQKFDINNPKLPKLKLAYSEKRPLGDSKIKDLKLM